MVKQLGLTRRKVPIRSTTRIKSGKVSKMRSLMGTGGCGLDPPTVALEAAAAARS
jgi:hypothetical protein